LRSLGVEELSRTTRRESKTTTKATDKEVLRGYVERMVEEKLADRRRQTPGKTQPPRGGQGARAKRESAQAKKDAAVSAPRTSTAVKSMRGSAGINQIARRELGPKRRH
jgi:hypothetical protein